MQTVIARATTLTSLHLRSRFVPCPLPRLALRLRSSLVPAPQPRRRPRRPRHRPRQQSCHVLCSIPRRSRAHDAPQAAGRPDESGLRGVALRATSSIFDRLPTGSFGTIHKNGQRPGGPSIRVASGHLNAADRRLLHARAFKSGFPAAGGVVHAPLVSPSACLPAQTRTRADRAAGIQAAAESWGFLCRRETSR